MKYFSYCFILSGFILLVNPKFCIGMEGGKEEKRKRTCLFVMNVSLKEQKNPAKKRRVKEFHFFEESCGLPIIYSLPDEILLETLSYLSPWNLISVGLASKKMYELAQDKTLWTRFAQYHKLTSEGEFCSRWCLFLRKYIGFPGSFYRAMADRHASQPFTTIGFYYELSIQGQTNCCTYDLLRYPLFNNVGPIYLKICSSEGREKGTFFLEGGPKFFNTPQRFKNNEGDVLGVACEDLPLRIYWSQALPGTLMSSSVQANNQSYLGSLTTEDFFGQAPFPQKIFLTQFLHNKKIVETQLSRDAFNQPESIEKQGDFYARIGRWQDAFNEYTKIIPVNRTTHNSDEWQFASLVPQIKGHAGSLMIKFKIIDSLYMLNKEKDKDFHIESLLSTLHVKKKEYSSKVLLEIGVRFSLGQPYSNNAYYVKEYLDAALQNPLVGLCSLDYLRAGDAYYKIGEFYEAEKCYAKVIKDNPDCHHDIYIKASKACFESKDYQYAAVFFQSAIARAPNLLSYSQDLYLKIAEMYFALNYFELAVYYLTQVLYAEKKLSSESYTKLILSYRCMNGLPIDQFQNNQIVDSLVQTIRDLVAIQKREHVDTLITILTTVPIFERSFDSLTKVGVLLFEFKKWDLAEIYLKEALTIGNTHP